jgi:membrane-bound lytic murein transglycosylase MltF
MPSTLYDPMIKQAIEEKFPQLLVDLPLGWLYVKAQMWQESRFKPDAVSSAGAMGLMQLMPGTAAGLGLTDPFSPLQNVRGGVQYLAEQYARLAEIPCHRDRLKFALASYNGGRGYVNRALELARKADGAPADHKGWIKAGRLPGLWQMWCFASQFLADSACTCRGKRPDHRQMTDYVARIMGRFEHYAKELSCRKDVASTV